MIRFFRQWWSEVKKGWRDGWDALNQPEIPEWPCHDEDLHEPHFWSDGFTGFECPGVLACPDCGERPCHPKCLSGGGLT